MIKEQIIDVTRSYLVTDPEAFYENLMVPVREDSPEKMLPVVAFEGYNFLPTLYGYRSYFDTASKLDIGTLSSRCDRILLYQFANYQNILVALCEDGIWTNSGGSTAEAWNHRITLSIPAVGSYLEWTFCVIENTLYMYRQGNSVVYTITQTSYSLGNPVQSITPSFLNMTGQMGIFRANGRLGFWDSANSVSWSSLFSFIDFTPSLETLAGFATFNDVLGRIVTIKASGSGFIIYSTKNIVGVSYNDTGSVLFSAKTIAEIAGIWTSKQVCTGAVDTEQFAYTNTGIKHISQGFKIEDIFPGVYDFLKESREPVYLDFLNGRYLFLSLINPDYISGKVSFKILASGTVTIRLLYRSGEVTSTDMIPEDVGGIPLEDYLESSLRSSVEEGLLTQWAVSGSKMVPSRVSSMQPYTLDDPRTPDEEGVYVENTDPLLTTSQLETARDTVVLSNPVSINDAIPSSIDLGWEVSVGTGLTGINHTRFVTRQKKEWAETEDRIDELKDAIAALAEKNSAETELPTEYATSGDAIAGTPADVLNVYTDLCTIPYKAAVEPVQTFTGVGTGTPTWEYKKVFTEGLKVRQKRDTHYLQRRCIYGWMWGENTCLALGGLSASPSLPNYCGSSYRAANPGGYHPELTVSYDAALGIKHYLVYDFYDVANTFWTTSKAHALTLVPYPSTISGTYVGPGTATGSAAVADFQYAVVSDAGDFLVYVDIYYKIPSTLGMDYSGTVFKGIRYSIGIGDLLGDVWKVTSYTTDSLSTSSAAITVESKASGSQENLTWAVYTEDNPPEGFDYATNEITLTFDGFDETTGSALPNSLTVTYPGATFLLQNATTAPIYPDFSGAIVYDIFLQKWGKAKASYRCLMDYSPINSNVEQVVDYTNFGLTAGILTPGGFLKLFSANCTDSFIRYGKLAFSRLGYTYPEELVVNFRVPFTGSIQTDVSMDGRSLHEALTEETAFTGVGVAKVYPSYSGQWHTISVKGLFDIRSMSYTGRVSGIR